MYYTSSGSYRKSKMFIDYANIVLTGAIVVIFIILLFLRSRGGRLFPIIFMLGAVMNGLTCAKSLMEHKKIGGIVLAVVTVILLVLAAVAWQVVTR